MQNFHLWLDTIIWFLKQNKWVEFPSHNHGKESCSTCTAFCLMFWKQQPERLETLELKMSFQKTVLFHPHFTSREQGRESDISQMGMLWKVMGCWRTLLRAGFYWWLLQFPYTSSQPSYFPITNYSILEKVSYSLEHIHCQLKAGFKFMPFVLWERKPEIREC